MLYVRVGVLFISPYLRMWPSERLKGNSIVNLELLRDCESQSHPSELDISPICKQMN